MEVPLALEEIDGGTSGPYGVPTAVTVGLHGVERVTASRYCSHTAASLVRARMVCCAPFGWPENKPDGCHVLPLMEYSTDTAVHPPFEPAVAVELKVPLEGFVTTRFVGAPGNVTPR
jgi:hypothetical protein